MVSFILGEKNEQGQIFNEKGERIPTTFIKTTPCYLLGIKNTGYCALKLGFGEAKNIQKPVAGEIKKAGVKTSLRFLREFRLEKYLKKIEIIEEDKKVGIKIGEVKLFVGDLINPTIIFKKGDLVNVTGTSKGKGFQGVVKRHGFKGGNRTHGQSHGERAPGSIGMSTTPGRVFKGKRMAGRMGNDTITLRNLEIVDLNEKGILVQGVIPGAKGGLVKVVSIN
jgi:large subunit ribosomal protein L3